MVRFPRFPMTVVGFHVGFHTVSTVSMSSSLFSLARAQSLEPARKVCWRTVQNLHFAPWSARTSCARAFWLWQRTRPWSRNTTLIVMMMTMMMTTMKMLTMIHDEDQHHEDEDDDDAADDDDDGDDDDDDHDDDDDADGDDGVDHGGGGMPMMM